MRGAGGRGGGGGENLQADRQAEDRQIKDREKEVLVGTSLIPNLVSQALGHATSPSQT